MTVNTEHVYIFNAISFNIERVDSEQLLSWTACVNLLVSSLDK